MMFNRNNNIPRNDYDTWNAKKCFTKRHIQHAIIVQFPPIFAYVFLDFFLFIVSGTFINALRSIFTVLTVLVTVSLERVKSHARNPKYGNVGAINFVGSQSVNARVEVEGRSRKGRLRISHYFDCRKD